MFRLDEASRNDLMAKSKSSQKGLQRYKRRVKSKVSSSTQEYNRIDMNQLFKKDILTVSIKVRGETDTYIVKISFGGLLDIIKSDLKRGEEFDLRLVIKDLVKAFNKDDVYVGCSCPDFFYRFGYYATVNKFNSDQPQLIPSKETNPDDSLGSACKHVLLVLTNTSWLIKVASVIVNYINYMEKYRERQYQDIIYPAIYGKKYEAPVQQDLFGDELDSDEQTIDTANIEARKKGQFKAGNPYRFEPKNTINNQIEIDQSTDIEEEE